MAVVTVFRLVKLRVSIELSGFGCGAGRSLFSRPVLCLRFRQGSGCTETFVSAGVLGSLAVRSGSHLISFHCLPSHFSKPESVFVACKEKF